MKNEIWILKWYILDPSSYKLEDVKVHIFDSLESAEKYLKKLAYQIYVDNEGDEVNIEEWKVEIFDSYDYEIYKDEIMD
jgi:RecJ-like exonuclease